ncbi:MAG: Rrf2 family transcriptional regulator [Anaerolineaceae bacterium]|nr:Rrf2 family transcriptional regulator [Anaerolineaceae bacterium]
MIITQQADYALRAVQYLASHSHGQRTSTSVIARERDIPPSFLAKIISQLSTAGIINTQRGAHGGVQLAKPAEEISMLDVIEAIEGPLVFVTCSNHHDGTCSQSDECWFCEPWRKAQELVTNHLSSVKFVARSCGEK